MIVSEEHRFAYLDMPKAGTHSIEAVLAKDFGAERIGMWHEPNLPRPYRSFFIFTTVRCPYARAVSIWWHLLFRKDYRSIWRGAAQQMGFVQFWRWCLARIRENDLAFAKRKGSVVFHGQTELISLLPRHADAIIHLENLDAECQARLPFWERTDAVPRRDSDDRVVRDSVYGDWREIMTDQGAELVEQWCPNDFESLGYSRDWRAGDGPLASIGAVAERSS